jgi:hypothetical protein
MIQSDIGAMVAILIILLTVMSIMANPESKQTKMHILEKTIKIQEGRINDIIALFYKTKSNSDSQIHDLDLRINKETQNIRVQINGLALNYKNTNKCKLTNKL